MKRWQVRGEVEDSEDEELSLENDSPSPERPRKRAKQDDLVDENDGTVSPLSLEEPSEAAESKDDNDDEAWLQPKVAKTYGRKANTIAPISSRTPTPAIADETGHGENVVKSVEQAIRDEDQNEAKPGSTSPKRSPAAPTLRRLSPQVIIPLQEQVLPTTELSPTQQQPNGEKFVFSDGSESGSESEDLPDVAELIGLARNGNKGRSLSRVSSPLSEREVSPPNPLDFLSRNEGHPSRSMEMLDDDDVTGESGLPTSTAIARRSFRARKPIQMNPYQHDRMQYLAQCRARGVKPVRVVEQEMMQRETQDASQSNSSQEGASFPLSSPPNDQTIMHSNSGPPQSHFGAGDSSDGKAASAHRLPKRRKIDRAQARDARQTFSRFDEYSIPPSPPRTGSDRSAASQVSSDTQRPRAGFRLPGGRSPAPLPTPQISSEARPTNIDNDSASDPSPRRFRHPRQQSVVSISSSSSSEDEAELEARRLQREKKRIRGVLPASWLKFDFKAQRKQRSATPPARRRENTTSPEKSVPQKGVATRIIGGTSRPNNANDLSDLFGDDSESDRALRAESPVRRQSHLDLMQDGLTITGTGTVDDELMENDFVDPMLATGTSRSAKRKKSRPKQPRITDALRLGSRQRVDFSEERLGRQTTRKRATGDNPRPKQARQLQRRGPSPVRLSIADAPRSPSAVNDDLPQFVRLALRRTRQDAKHGRHSPTHKAIRLATVDDTEDAVTVLRAWREGTIAPRTDRANHPVIPNIAEYHNDTETSGERSALQEISSNRRQQTLPPGVRTQKRRVQASRQSIRKPRMRQTQLQPEGLNVDEVNDNVNDQPAIQRLNDMRARKPVGRHLNAQRIRGAQLETLERDFHQEHRSAVFERRMQCLTESIARPSRTSRASDFQLARFLQTDFTDETEPVERFTRKADHNDQIQAMQDGQQHLALPQRPRKARANRIDVEARRFRQPSEPIPEILLNDDLSEGLPVISEPVLQGLPSFGVRFPVDFDIRPLEVGTFFYESTFIGSGEFHDALLVTHRNLDVQTGRMRVHLTGEVVEWGPWTEDVATHFSRIPQAIAEALQALETPEAGIDLVEQRLAVESNIDYLLRSVVRYCSKCLTFVDSIDRQPCITSLERIVQSLSEIVADLPPKSASQDGIVVRTLQYAIIIARQARQICEDAIIPLDVRRRVDEQLLRNGKFLSKHALTGRLDRLRSFYEDNRRAESRESGIRDNAWTLSSVVILNHIFENTAGSTSLFWQATSDWIHSEVDDVRAVGELDRRWHDLFTILPALEIDSLGVSHVGSRLNRTQQNWTLVKALVSRVLQLYEASSQVRGFTVNDYVRALLSRCHCLVNQWGWRNCEPILNTVYDFFAQRNLGLLRNEEGKGSPRFLEDLDSASFFDVLPDDRSFHIFLKLLATGLRGMRKYHVYGDGKIVGIAWRLVPNHSRTYRKDADMQRSDLEALRNHYDLLSTLYIAMPPGKRINVDTPRNLVDHSSSHREACRLSARAWANMASSQASTTEDTESTEVLADWFTDIMRINIAQYRLAQSEAERAKKEAENDGVFVAEATVESAVAKNQQEITKIIVEALAGLKRALTSASSMPQAKALIERSNFWSVFDLYDPRQYRLLSTMNEALHVIVAAMDVEQRYRRPQQSQTDSNNESQDFGDSSALQEFVSTNDPDQQYSTSIIDLLSTPTVHFVSNVFGADLAGDNTLLEKTIDIWIRLASFNHQSGPLWHSYVDEYSTTSWFQLRDTTQRRKFTGYFMSRIIEMSVSDPEVIQKVMTAWLLSLVEREAMLKFQHRLTSSLLNHHPYEPLLQNLPFAKEGRTGEYSISLSDLRQRRLALISSILCNMREDFEESAQTQPSRKGEIQSLYRVMLRQLMQAMKSNYQELQASYNPDVADAAVHGAYVEFVQQVVSFLQQHTSTICQVDRFFTDSSAFPLPAGDPTYVVGRLRAYMPKLADSKARAQLAVFVQTVSERAAVDEQQRYLVSQLAISSRSVTERGDRNAPSLRHVLLTSIFPAYIEAAFSTECSWILLSPVLQACQSIIQDLLYNMQIEENDSLQGVLEILSAMIQSITQQCDFLLAQTGLLERPHVLVTVCGFIEVVKASLTVASFIQRSTSLGGELYQRLTAFRSLTSALERLINEPNPDFGVDYEQYDGADFVSPWSETKVYAEKQIRLSSGNWHAMDGRYFVRRGNLSKVVRVELGSRNYEREKLLMAIEDFSRAFDGAFEMRRARRHEGDMLGGIVV